MTRARLLVILGALCVVAAAVALLGSPVRASGPEPIRYGRDACAHCRMHLATPGFAGERRDAAGVLHKYDDLGCLLIAASRGASGEVWVEDHDDKGFVPLLEAALVAGDGLGTPMDYGVLAFRDRRRAEEFASAHGARVVGFEELVRDGNRFRASGQSAEVRR